MLAEAPSTFSRPKPARTQRRLTAAPLMTLLTCSSETPRCSAAPSVTCTQRSSQGGPRGVSTWRARPVILGKKGVAVGVCHTSLFGGHANLIVDNFEEVDRSNGQSDRGRSCAFVGDKVVMVGSKIRRLPSDNAEGSCPARSAPSSWQRPGSCGTHEAGRRSERGEVRRRLLGSALTKLASEFPRRGTQLLEAGVGERNMPRRSTERPCTGEGYEFERTLECLYQVGTVFIDSKAW